MNDFNGLWRTRELVAFAGAAVFGALWILGVTGLVTLDIIPDGILESVPVGETGVYIAIAMIFTTLAAYFTYERLQSQATLPQDSL